MFVYLEVIFQLIMISCLQEFIIKKMPDISYKSLVTYKNIFSIFKKKKSTDHDLTETIVQDTNMSWQNYKLRYGTEVHENVYDHPDLTAVYEIIENRFYFATLISGIREPTVKRNLYMFDIDNELVYDNYFDDFGPLNIACLYKYCRGVNQILKNPEHKSEQIVHFTCDNLNKRANAAYLAASYSVLYLNKSPMEVYQKISHKNMPNLKPFQDASMGFSPYTITLVDCLNALYKAASLGFFNFDDFDVREYEKYEKLKHGDIHWIIPRKFLAFPGPSTEPGSNAHYPEKYLNYFMKNEVSCVIRLNRKSYESFRFTNAGIMHIDMFFPDGSVPPRKILNNFLEFAETAKGAIAVHCKAGLGRTGTLIAAYVIKHYMMSAKEAIAWLRICRPGSVIGHQQSWLEEMEKTLWRDGQQFRLQNYGNENLITHHKRGIYSIAENSDSKIRLRDCQKGKKLKRTCSDKKINGQSSQQSSSSRYLSANESEEYENSKNKKFNNIKREKLITQGDKLIEIKMKRNPPTTDSFKLRKINKYFHI